MMGLLAGFAGGCSDVASPESPFNNPSLRSLVWNSTTPAQIDSNSGIAFSPEITVEPDGGGSAFAVWVERVDLNEFDLKPAVYHIHARRFSGGNWSGTDAVSGCNPGGDNGLDDGICILDSGSRDFDAWAPEITMDNNGDAILVWQQADASDCDPGLGGVQTCTSIYAREYTAGGSWTAPANIDGGNTPASSPDVAMEPDGGGTAFAVWSQMASEAEAWSTSADRGGNTIVDLEEYNGKIYAAEMDGGTARVLVLNERTGTWSVSTTFGAITIYSLQTYCRNSDANNQDNCRLYAGLGTGADGGGDVYMFDGTSWTDIFNAGAIGTGDSQTMVDFTV
ncbi:MAG TPA: hypothetical protein VLB09_07810, partial [Nitrospiria bacterium]|nr:hypothetical protein [Nitrospiria bacterium]